MNKALIAAVATAFLLAGEEVQAGAGEAGTAGGSSKNSYGKSDNGGGGGWRFTPSEPRHWRQEGSGKKVPGGIYGGGPLNSNGQNPNGPGMQGSSQTGQDTGK